MRPIVLLLLTAATPPVFPASVLAESAPPSQELASDPAPPAPRVGISADAVGVVLADYALRLDWVPEAVHALGLEVGLSRRHGSDALLVTAGWTAWPLGDGLEALWLGLRVGVAWPGPWNGAVADAPVVGRLEGELGWQFLLDDVSIALGAGVTGFWSPVQGSVWIEPHGRAALGLVFR